jgi:uncharacterized integral membrane protein
MSDENGASTIVVIVGACLIGLSLLANIARMIQIYRKEKRLQS